MSNAEFLPLAERMRPKTPDELIGQEFLLGQNGVLRKVIEKGTMPSVILWAPPGTGKTSIAQIIASMVKMPFRSLNAVQSGVKEVREIIEETKNGRKILLFIDEIHRFNKSQQDALLFAVEKGLIALIGATTENPSFEINSALLSRCQVYTLKALDKTHLRKIADNALQNDVFLAEKKLHITEEEALFNLSDGDARKMLNLLELAAESAENQEINNEIVIQAAQKRTVLYDKNGEQHYDIISAFIKSMRGSDPNASVYWLARMIEGGEDVKFIARRMVIFSSEDIGNANPTALVIAVNTFQAVNLIGYPEAEIILSQCAVYLACSAKSNASYSAIKKAKSYVREKGNLPVPMQLRNAPTKLMKNLDYGKGYLYAHDHPGNFIALECMPEEIAGTVFYQPGKNAREEEMRQFLKRNWKEKYGY
jgi:putative ATPase